MNYTGLSLDEAPPFSIPLRFFLSAPPFGVAAALLLAWTGPQALASRWTPAALAAVHLMTLGYLTMVMAGATLQLLPVLAGARIARTRTVSASLHVLLCAGTALLAVGFMTTSRTTLHWALVILIAALASLILVTGGALHGAPSRPQSGRGLGLSLAALAITLTLAAWLAERYLTPHAPALAWTDVHLVWGLLGWVGLLVITVARQVVPMFQMTPAYPVLSDRWLARAIFLSLVGWSMAMGFVIDGRLPPRASALAALPIALGYGWFAAATLWLQHRRRRRLPDVTVAYWRLGMGCLLLAIGLWLAGLAVPALARNPHYAPLLGVLVILGFGVSVIHGMLCKILPFLAWLHLHRARFASGHPRATIPSMKELLPQRAARRQFRLQFLSLVLLCAATLWPAMLTRPAALLLAAAFAEFGRLTVGTAWRYRLLARAAPA